MKILSLDTSGKTASISLLESEEVVAEIFYNLERNYSELLLPAIQHLLVETGMGLGDFDIFACTVGPGSFTGIRIGVATVKGLALAVHRPVVGVSTLAALALNAAGLNATICPMIDAKRDQVYMGLYREDNGGSLTSVIPDCLKSAEDALVAVPAGTVFVGTGAERYVDVIRRTLPGKSNFAAPHLHKVSAAAAGIIAGRIFSAGGQTDALKLAPMYLRRSEAEEKKILNVDMTPKFT